MQACVSTVRQKVQRVEHHLSRWWYLGFFLIALLVVAADQLTKMWIRAYSGAQPIFKIGFFRIIHVQNSGAAFGLFHDQNFILAIVAFIGIILILFFVFYVSRRYPVWSSGPGTLALGLVMGGTGGNLVDRLSRGYVTDFIDVGAWPTFNVADSAVTVGIILFACSLLYLSHKAEASKGQ